VGRAAIHPRQLPVIVASFIPTPEEVEIARRIVDGFARATEAGGGTYVTPDGAFIDIAMIRAAQGVLALHATHHGTA
jgi:citrate lyase subunit beta/citryl-CoA lyase